MIDAINPATSAAQTSALTANATASGNGRTTEASLRQQDFLKLLTVQLANQDPLNPTDNAEFLAQMAQFTSLQQTTDISETLDTLANSIIAQQQAPVNYLGKQVTLTSNTNQTITGVVSKVGLDGGIPYVTINGVEYPAYSITSVTNAPVAATTPTTPPPLSAPKGDLNLAPPMPSV